MDKLWAMEVFARVIESGSFSRAAESLNLANATVTACIRNLERSLGVTLIQRNTRHLHLTEEGSLFFTSSQEVLRAVARAEADVRSRSGEVTGVLHVEMPFAMGHALICPALPILMQRHPGLAISVRLTNQPHRLIEHAIDVAIRLDQVEDADLVARPIYQSRAVVCASPELAQAHPLATPHDLDPKLCMGLVSDGANTTRDWIFRKDDDEFVVRPQGSISLSSSDALINIALQGVGFVCVLDVFANKYFASGRLVELFGDWEQEVRTFYAVTPKSRYVGPKVRALTDFLLEILGPESAASIRQPVGVLSSRNGSRTSSRTS